jgi:hypothetical protein
MFAMTRLSNDDLDDFDQDYDLVTCPSCLRTFDPSIQKSASAAESQATGLEELIDLADDGNGEESET